MLLIFSIIGTIAGLLGIYEIRVSTSIVIRSNSAENVTILQTLHPKPRAISLVEAEIEKDDSYDINLLRFTGTFGFVYLAFLLLAGIDYLSTNYCNDQACWRDSNIGLQRPEGWVTIMMGTLGFAEISSIITFLAQLKRKVTYSMNCLKKQLSE